MAVVNILDPTKMANFLLKSPQAFKVEDISTGSANYSLPKRGSRAPSEAQDPPHGSLETPWPAALRPEMGVVDDTGWK